MTVVLDSSAIIAAIKDEPGGNMVYAALEDALVCTVNVGEVYGVATVSGWSIDAADGFLAAAGLKSVALSPDIARSAGLMAGLTRAAGLSLGDRCCLALAIHEQAEVLTADRAWVQFAEPLGLSIKLIR